jgi:hypothetical protein
MIFPKKLKIGGHSITVEVSDLTDMERQGDTDRAANKIRVCTSLAKSAKEAALFHEIFHVMNSELDHALLESLSEQIYQVLSDNKMLR